MQQSGGQAWNYRVFGIDVESQIQLTSNQSELKHSAEVSSQILQGQVLMPKPGVAEQIAAFCWGNKDEVWLDIPNVAKFYLTAQQIIVEQAAESDPDLLQVYMQGYALGIQAMLAGKLVLHATTLSLNDKAIILCGSSGSGKSTLAAALLARGYTLVSDEVTVLDQNGLVQPGFDDIKLWHDAAEVLALPAQQTQPIRSAINKFYYRPQQQVAAPVRPAVVYVLGTDNRIPAELTEVTGFAKFEPLRSQYYRPFLVKPLQLDTLYLQLSGKFLGALPLVRVLRDMQHLSAERLSLLADLVMQDAGARSVL